MTAFYFYCFVFQGVPVRVEVGPRDMKDSQVMAVRRYNGAKEVLKADFDFAKKVSELLDNIHHSMFKRAKEQLEGGVCRTSDWTEFVSALDRKKLLLSPFCGAVKCEEKIKKDSKKDENADPGAPSMGAKSLCIPNDQPGEDVSKLDCIMPGCPVKPQYFTLFGRSY